jgi:large subunit ribosomal protein L28
LENVRCEHGFFTPPRQTFFGDKIFFSKKCLQSPRNIEIVEPQFSKTNHFKEKTIMSRVCAITGKRPTKGRSIVHKGQSKKSGGIGLQLVKQTKRTFKPNLQRIRVKLPNGSIKRLWVSVKALKAGLVEKA